MKREIRTTKVVDKPTWVKSQLTERKTLVFVPTTVSCEPTRCCVNCGYTDLYCKCPST